LGEGVDDARSSILTVMGIRTSKSNRVLALIAAMGVASFTVGGLVAVVTSGEKASLASATADLAQLDVLAGNVAVNLSAEQAALDDYVLSGSALARDRYEIAVKAETATVDEITGLTRALPAVVAALETLERDAMAWRTNVAGPALQATANHDLEALEQFRTSAVGDQDELIDGLDRLNRSLSTAKDAIGERRAAVDVMTAIGIAVAFGFVVIAFGVALVAVRRFGRAVELDASQASVLNSFTELTSFATDDHEVAVSNLVAIDRLVHPDAAVTHILNRSMDRAVPEATTGSPIADVLPLHALETCAGVVRGTLFVSDDLADDLTVHCKVYPATSGTLACVPLTSGESVGAVHLYWARPHALSLELRSSLTRITEHAALAIGNRRLLAALHGQANTDARTGLSNSRAFDLTLEKALAGRVNGESLAVLMLDIDHFKQFNDRHGHPAGDEALKAFATVLRSCMRDADIAARYGGEEFAVLLPGVDLVGGQAIAERIRARTEATIISLAPGMTDRITVSIGVAAAPDQAQDRVSLLRLADAALYRAKGRGRNRVDALAGDDTASMADATGPLEPDRSDDRRPGRVLKRGA
jgi:diguanylate cyclase (GGDEF)-like protein